MAQATRLYLFGDQTYDFVPKLKELLSYHESPILTAFLDQAHYVIRAESIESLPVAVHKASRTANLAELVQKYTEGKLGPAFQTALACTSQLGAFIRYSCALHLSDKLVRLTLPGMWSRRSTHKPMTATS